METSNFYSLPKSFSYSNCSNNDSDEQKPCLIEYFFDLDGTLIRDGSIVSVFHQLKKISENKFYELLNCEEDTNVLISNTINFLRPNLKELFTSLNNLMQKTNGLIRFSIYTANLNIELYAKMIQIIEKQLGTNIFSNFYLAYGLKDIEQLSQCKYQFMVDNNYTVPQSQMQKLIKVNTFQPKEYLTEQAFGILKKYLLDLFFPNNEAKLKSTVQMLLNDVEESQEQRENMGKQPDSELLSIARYLESLTFDIIAKEQEEQMILNPQQKEQLLEQQSDQQPERKASSSMQSQLQIDYFVEEQVIDYQKENQCYKQVYSQGALGLENNNENVDEQSELKTKKLKNEEKEDIKKINIYQNIKKQYLKKLKRKHKLNITRNQQKILKDKNICLYYLDGRCKYQKACKNLHKDIANQYQFDQLIKELQEDLYQIKYVQKDAATDDDDNNNRCNLLHNYTQCRDLIGSSLEINNRQQITQQC